MTMRSRAVRLREAPREYALRDNHRREAEGSRECLPLECRLKAFARSSVERIPWSGLDKGNILGVLRLALVPSCRDSGSLRMTVFNKEILCPKKSLSP